MLGSVVALKPLNPLTQNLAWVIRLVMGRYRYSVFLSVFLNVGIGVGISILNTASIVFGVGVGVFARCPTVLFSEHERFSRSLYGIVELTDAYCINKMRKI